MSETEYQMPNAEDARWLDNNRNVLKDAIRAQVEKDDFSALPLNENLQGYSKYPRTSGLSSDFYNWRAFEGESRPEPDELEGFARELLGSVSHGESSDPQKQKFVRDLNDAIEYADYVRKMRSKKGK